MDEENAYLLGNKLGEVCQVELVDVNRPYLRVQVKFELEAPLHLGFYLPRDQGKPVWIAFKYERLSSFCLACGRLTHTMDTCTDEMHPYQFARGEDMRGMVPMDESQSGLVDRMNMMQENFEGRGVTGGRGRSDFHTTIGRVGGRSSTIRVYGNQEGNLGFGGMEAREKGRMGPLGGDASLERVISNVSSEIIYIAVAMNTKCQTVDRGQKDVCLAVSHKAKCQEVGSGSFDRRMQDGLGVGQSLFGNQEDQFLVISSSGLGLKKGLVDDLGVIGGHVALKREGAIIVSPKSLAKKFREQSSENESHVEESLAIIFSLGVGDSVGSRKKKMYGPKKKSDVCLGVENDACEKEGWENATAKAGGAGQNLPLSSQ